MRRFLVIRADDVRRRREQLAARRAAHGPERRVGFWGPIPYFSTRTRRGSEVSVGGCGCCLPIPLLAGLGVAGTLRAVWRRMR